LVARLDVGKRLIGVDEFHQMSHLSTSSLAALVPSAARSSSDTGSGP
jgi:hypothetical protein